MCESVYALLLRLYPKQFRAEYGDEALQLFRDRLHNERGVIRRMRFWFDITIDLRRSLVLEHRLASQASPIPVAFQPVAFGAPRLYVFDQRRPATGCLIAGIALSMVTFWVISVSTLRGEGNVRPGHALAGVSSPGRLGAAWSFGSALQSRQRQIDLSQLPDTPAARKFRERYEVQKTGNYEALLRFYSENLDAVDEGTIVGNAATDADMFRRFGRRNIVAFEVEESTPLRLVLLTEESGSTSYPSAWVRHEIEVTPDEPHKIVRQQDISFGPQKPSAGLTQILPPSGFQFSDRKAPDPAFPTGEAPWEKPFAVATSVMQSYVGTYDFAPPNNTSMVVTYRDGQLYAQLSGQEQVRMFPKTETRFYAEGRVMRWIEFTKSENGQVHGLVANSSGFELTGSRRK